MAPSCNKAYCDSNVIKQAHILRQLEAIWAKKILGWYITSEAKWRHATAHICNVNISIVPHIKAVCEGIVGIALTCSV